MFCDHCGMRNERTKRRCCECGAPLGEPPPLVQQSVSKPIEVEVARPNVPSYMLLSLFATFCCSCMPVGILAIIFSAQVNSKLKKGDIEGARTASNRALTCALISICSGLFLPVAGLFR